MRWPRRLAAALLSLGLVTACSPSNDPEARYAQNYADHEPLHVVGYPSTGSLRITQEALWRIADGAEEDLAGLATGDATASEAQKTATNWIKSFQKGAVGKVSADFYGDGVDRQTVVLYFHDTKQVKELHVRLDGNAGEDGWRVVMNEPDPKQAATAPTWAPTAPGGLDSNIPN
ncbi:hypothetical protein [Streptomyces sp. NPDC047928]|uniref:hypothetical protein n=1 Tax=unclassified Streptomyces TaxID=2593676 RepID=UPI0037247817